jgi:hypothetical protein
LGTSILLSVALYTHSWGMVLTPEQISKLVLHKALAYSSFP